MYLLDTNVISALAPTKSLVFPELREWLNRNTDVLFLSIITIVEIEAGIAKLERAGMATKAAPLKDWLGILTHLYQPRILPVDFSMAKYAGQFADQARGTGRPVGFADVLIAATAASHKLSILTRNTKHFSAFPLDVLDPFQQLPG